MAKKTDTQNELAWRAAEYQYVEKDTTWYFIIVAAALILTILSLIQKNFFFAVFVIIAAAMIIFFARRKPQVVDFRITEKGVAIGENAFYDYDRLEGFAIVKKPNRLDEIVVKRKAVVNPYVKIPVDSENRRRAEEILKIHLPEVTYEESLLDIVSDWFGF